MLKTDVVVLGAGPVGLFAAFQAGMLDMKCHIVDAINVVGGQCMALYPDKPIYDIPAHVKITGMELIANLESQANTFKPQYHLGQHVHGIEQNADGSFVVKTSKNTHITCNVIVVAAGGGAFEPNRPPLQNLEQYEGKSVFYAVHDISIFEGKKVVIAGGGDSAADWAISISKIANLVYLVHRREHLRCVPDSCTKIKDLVSDGKIKIITQCQLESINGSDGYIRKVVVKDFQGQELGLEADFLLPFFGLSMNLGPIANWGLNLHKKHISVDPSNMRTSVFGIYAVGDIAHYQHKLKLISLGFAECALALHDALSIVFPEKAFHIQYSTSKFAKCENS